MARSALALRYERAVTWRSVNLSLHDTDMSKPNYYPSPICIFYSYQPTYASAVASEGSVTVSLHDVPAGGLRLVYPANMPCNEPNGSVSADFLSLIALSFLVSRKA